MSDKLRSMRISLNSVEEMSSALADSAWTTDFRQLEKGAGPVDITAVASSAALLMKTELHCKVHQLGALSPDSVTFGLPAHTQAPIRFGNQDTGSSVLTLFNNRSEFEAVSDRNFSAYTITFGADSLAQRMESFGFDIDRISQVSYNQHQQLSESTTLQLRQLMKELLSLPEAFDVPLPVSALEIIDSELAYHVLSAYFDSHEAQVASISNRSRAVRRAVNYINDNVGEVLTVERLCSESACSISTLERSFHEHFGVSPKQYLMATRLSGARKDFLSPERERGIGDIAAQWGFWHMSKFAADYKKMFGELPSRTIRVA